MRQCNLRQNCSLTFGGPIHNIFCWKVASLHPPKIVESLESCWASIKLRFYTETNLLGHKYMNCIIYIYNNASIPKETIKITVGYTLSVTKSLALIPYCQVE